MAKSIFQRKRDLVYLVFFIIHVPIMLGEFLVQELNGHERYVLSSHHALHRSDFLALPLSRSRNNCLRTTSLISIYVLLPRDVIGKNIEPLGLCILA